MHQSYNWYVVFGVFLFVLVHLVFEMVYLVFGLSILSLKWNIWYRDHVFGIGTMYLVSGPYLLVFDIEVRLPTNPEREALTCTS